MHKPLRVFLIVILLMCGVLAAVGIWMGSVTRKLDSLADLVIQEVDLSHVQDGIHTGSYAVFPVRVRLEVTVKDHRIMDIKLLEHRNGQGSSAQSLLGLIVQRQSLRLDTVSGATYSSKVILKAVEVALSGESR